MTGPNSTLSDDDLLELARSAARPTPTSSDSARLARQLEQSLADEVQSRRRAVSPAFAAAAIVCAAAASATTAFFLAPSLPAKTAPPPAFVTPSVPSSSSVAVPPVTPLETVEVPDVIEAAPVVDVAPTKATKKKPTKKSPPWQQQADRLSEQGDLRAAATAAAAAVVESPDRGGAVTLWGLAGRDPRVIDALDGAIAAAESDEEALARVMRLSCELRLRHRRDTVAVEACRAFGERFPNDRAARPLAFAAGGLAEELGDLDGAIDEYTRSIVLAPFMGASGADGLLARARVRTRLGQLDEARADLRVYLQKDPRPGDTHDDEVQGLARALSVELP